MDIKFDLLKEAVSELIFEHIESISVDADKIADTTAIRALREIQSVLKNDALSDFEPIEEIVCIFETYHISAGARHDF